MQQASSVWDVSGEAEIQIRVTDMNDNAPFFNERVYTARVPENTDVGTIVMTVIAEDLDEGMSAKTRLRDDFLCVECGVKPETDWSNWVRASSVHVHFGTGGGPFRYSPMHCTEMDMYRSGPKREYDFGSYNFMY